MEHGTAPPRKWLRFLAWELPLLAVSGLAFYYWRSGPVPDPEPPREPISLAVVGRAGQLEISWNPAAPTVRSAAEGRIEIADGIESQSVALTPAMLADGRYSYVPATEDVRVQMTLHDASGARTEGTLRFLGALPEVNLSQGHQLDLEDELRRLREINEAQAARIRDLEVSLKRIQASLGIGGPPQ